MIRFRRPKTVQVDRRMNSCVGEILYLETGVFHVKHALLKITNLLAALFFVILITGCGAQFASPEGWASPVEYGNRAILLQGEGGRLALIDGRMESSETPFWWYPERVVGVSDSGGGFLSGLFGGGSDDDWSSDPFYARPLVVQGDVLYVVSTSGILRKLSSLNGVTESPSEVWALEIGEVVISTPVQLDSSIFVGTDEGSLLRISDATGQIEAKWDIGVGRIWSSLQIYNDDLLVVDMGEGILMRINGKSGEVVNSVDLGGGVPGDGLMVGDSMYLGTFGGQVHRVNLKDFSIDWSVTGNGWFAGPFVSKGAKIYAATTRGSVLCLDGSTGSIVWSKDIPESNFRSRPAIIGNDLVLADREGALVGLDADTGSLRWSSAVDDEVYADLFIYEGQILLLSKSHALFEIDANSGAIRTVLTGE